MCGKLRLMYDGQKNCQELEYFKKQCHAQASFQRQEYPLFFTIKGPFTGPSKGKRASPYYADYQNIRSGMADHIDADEQCAGYYFKLRSELQAALATAKTNVGEAAAKLQASKVRQASCWQPRRGSRPRARLLPMRPGLLMMPRLRLRQPRTLRQW